MISKTDYFTNRQLIFQELFVGTLIYIVVLGLFNDYTSIVYAKSFSTIIYASLILEILTYVAFQLKSKIVSFLKKKPQQIYKILMFFSVWLIMFLSKFVFIWFLDIFFGNYIEVKGFFGILLVVLCVTIIHRLAYYIFKSLGQSQTFDK